jgi:hypothetical protein
MSHLQQFRVIGNYTADGAGALANCRIFPAIIVPGTGSGGDINVNTAHATVGTVPANGAVDVGVVLLARPTSLVYSSRSRRSSSTLLI